MEIRFCLGIGKCFFWVKMNLASFIMFLKDICKNRSFLLKDMIVYIN